MELKAGNPYRIYKESPQFCHVATTQEDSEFSKNGEFAIFLNTINITQRTKRNIFYIPRYNRYAMFGIDNVESYCVEYNISLLEKKRDELKEDLEKIIYEIDRYENF